MQATNLLDELDSPNPTLTIEQRMKRVENVTQVFLGYMRGKRSMKEMEDLLSMASKLGGELLWSGSDYPPENASTPSFITDDRIPPPVEPEEDFTEKEEEPNLEEILIV